MAICEFWESTNCKPGNGAYSKVSMVVRAQEPLEAVDAAERFGKEQGQLRSEQKMILQRRMEECKFTVQPSDRALLLVLVESV